MTTADWHSTLLVEFLPGGRLRLIVPLWVSAGGVEVTIPAGFESDGASVFVWARWLIGSPLDWKNLVPGILHDYLVTRQADGQLPVSRERAALVFRAALRMRRKRSVTRALMYLAVAADAVGRRVLSWFTGKI